VQNLSHSSGADCVNDAVDHGLAGQVFARPVRDVQTLGDRFQASQLHDLSALEGGKAAEGDPDDRLPTARRPNHAARNRGRLSRQWPGRTASETPTSARAVRCPCPTGAWHARPGTRDACDSGPAIEEWKCPADRLSKGEGSGHAWATSNGRTGNLQANSCKRISCIISCQGH